MNIKIYAALFLSFYGGGGFYVSLVFIQNIHRSLFLLPLLIFKVTFQNHFYCYTVDKSSFFISLLQMKAFDISVFFFQLFRIINLSS